MNKAFRNCIWILASTASFLLNGCHAKPPVERESTESGTINISVDETYKPVIDEQIKVFEASYPHAKIIVHYKPEADCLRDLATDSATRMVIVTRGLSDEEEQYYKSNIQFVPISDKLANDAVALVVNNDSPDSVLTLKRIRGILDGSAGNKVKAVFDGFNATSTVRYAQDSILKGKPLSKENALAVENSQAVIDYVAQHKDVIGFVGVNWVGDQDDPGQLSFIKKVKIAAIECPSCGSNIFVKPYQANIMYKRYPFVRGLYFILKENYAGPGSGFTNFMSLERGQLIFRRAYLGTAKIDFTLRNVSL